jgi:hypothetical protein
MLCNLNDCTVQLSKITIAREHFETKMKITKIEPVTIRKHQKKYRCWYCGELIREGVFCDGYHACDKLHYMLGKLLRTK